ncbi:hypothetical protein L0Y49_00260 [bacterium]|nr:hypothetical protein [bacterium]MCI0565902.1 hypothetical protein [bacterium]MCI0680229.1 hypothetical protein [bacterium]
MNKENEQNIEEIIEKTLAYLDGGKSPAEISRAFPEHQKTVEDIAAIAKLLQKEGEAVIPPRELLIRIIEHAKSAVTNQADSRYLFKKEVKGRPSLHNITKIYESMASKWKIIVPAGIVVVVVLLVVFARSGTGVPRYADMKDNNGGAMSVTEAVPPVATGDIDDVIAGLLDDSANEALAFNEERTDINLIEESDQVANDFGQSYDEKDI